MGSFTNTMETLVLQNIFGPVAERGLTLTFSNFYIGLTITAITEAEFGGEVTNITATATALNYARASTNTWTVINGQALNGTAITFNTASGTWGNVVGFGLFYVTDVTNTSSLIMYGGLSLGKSIDTGDTAQFAIGSIVINLD